ncbi:MAG: Rieske 2Fe-2S domain-containing protein [Planctomycetaceae bacterium]
MSHKPSSPVSGEIGELPRRSLLTRALALIIGGIVTVLPGIPAVLYFIDPLTRRKRAVGMSGDMIDREGFIKVAPQDALGELPRQFKVVTDLRDFWNKFANTEIGSVYLWKKPDGQIACFNARCPHLGCTVKFDDESKTFECPCHASAFSLDGKPTNRIPPRSLDALVTKPDKDGTVRVKYQKFRAGTEEQIPV